MSYDEIMRLYPEIEELVCIKGCIHFSGTEFFQITEMTGLLDNGIRTIIMIVHGMFFEILYNSLEVWHLVDGEKSTKAWAEVRRGWRESYIDLLARENVRICPDCPMDRSQLHVAMRQVFEYIENVK